MSGFFSRFTSGGSREKSGETPMADLVEHVVKALVDHPDQVRVSEVAGEGTIAMELRVAKEDLGKVIGRKGRTAGALRTILSAAGTKAGKKYVLEIIE